MDRTRDAESELFRLAPEDFVAERDARVAAAKEAGDREAATAIAALRRPTRAAWLTNLLVQDRPDDMEGLLGMADTLATAQRTLDGAALRQVSAQRSKLLSALSRQAAALGRDAGHRVDSGLERDVRAVLEAALADPELADRVRSGQLVRAERHAGFGVEPDADAQPRPADAPGRAGSGGRAPGSVAGGSGADGSGVTDQGPAGHDRNAATDQVAERERARREKAVARAQADLDRAQQAADQARERHDTARDEAAEAERHREQARERVTELIEELDRAREESAAANRAAHSAATAEKEAARTARTADTARDRAAAALADLTDG